MAKKCGKCDPHEICEECPEWIFTLADLIMCMMGLFVLLWVLKESGSKASSPAQAQKMQDQFLRGFEQGFSGYIPNPSDPNDPTQLRKLNGPGERGQTNSSPQSPDGTENLSSVIRPGREVTTGGKLLFAKGVSDLDDELKAKLDRVAELIRGHRQIVQIKGHTSRDDLALDVGPNARMAISLKRAQAAADYLVLKGVQPEVLRVQGCSTFEPIRQGDSSANAQSLNRRVEVFASDTLVDQLQDPEASGAPLSKLAAPAKTDGHDDEHDAKPAKVSGSH